MTDSLADQRLNFAPHHARRGAAILPASHHPGAPHPDLWPPLWESQRGKIRSGLMLGSNQLKTSTGLDRCMSSRPTYTYCTSPHPLSSFIPSIPLNIPSPLFSSLSVRALLIIHLTSQSDELHSRYSQQLPRRGCTKSLLIKRTRASRQHSTYSMPTVSPVKQMSHCFCSSRSSKSPSPASATAVRRNSFNET